MYGKTFCVLIIVLVLIYNLATGSVETVASSNTESLTSWATYGTLVQAGAAVITLGIMVWLGVRQNKLTKRQNELMQKQVNLALYKKRYKLYRQVLEFNANVNRIQFPNKNNVFEYELFKEPACVEELEEIIENFCSNSWEREFLLPADIKSYIDSLINNANKYVHSLNDPINNTQKEWVIYYERVKEAKKPFILKEKEIYEKFYSVLDFTNL